jgi:hypothetical protein
METKNSVPQCSDEALLDLLQKHQLVSKSTGWKPDPKDPFSTGVKVSPNHPVVGPIPPLDGKLAWLRIRGGSVYGRQTLELMASKDYFLLDSSQLDYPPGPSGHIYVSFQPHQVPDVPAGNDDLFLFMVKIVGDDLPPSFMLEWRATSHPQNQPLMLVDIGESLYCGVIRWKSEFIEISGSFEIPVEFHWASLRRLFSS